MRPWEWLFLFSLLPALFLPFSPRLRQHRRWLVAVALLPLLASLPHLFLEGWRTQMLPLYALALLVGALRLFPLRGKGAPRQPNRFASVLLVLVVAASGILPGWLLPVAALPAPTGPYSVGTVDRELVDTARGRRLMVSIWYPAAHSGPPAKLTAYPDELANGLATSFGLPLAAPALQHLRYFEVAASNAAPVAAGDAPFPILIFSHGLVGVRFQNSQSMQELASWGYVVVALDHTDAAAVTVFPDGETRLFDLQRFGIGPDESETSTDILLPVWVADQRFVYDQLAAWTVNDPLLAGKLDPQRIGSFGHSFGGATALAVCRVDPRCRAAANLDGGVSGTDPQAASRPMLLMTAASSYEVPDAAQNWSRLVHGATAPAYWLEIPDSNHYSFTILPLISPALAPLGADVRASLSRVDTYLRAFFDQYLRGQATPLFDPATGENGVRWRFR